MRHPGVIQTICLLLILSLASAVHSLRRKYTVKVGPSKSKCFKEVLTSKGTHKISYQILDNDGKKLELENEEDSIISVYFSRNMDGGKLYENSKYSGKYSHDVYSNSFIMRFCVENFSEDKEIKFSLGIAWALEINDFSMLPLTVISFLSRIKT